MKFITGLFSGPYAMLAKLGTIALINAVLIGALLWWGHTKYQAGVRDTDAKWELASKKLKEQAVAAAGRADVRAGQRVEAFTAAQAAEKEKLDEAERSGGSGFDVLFGPGGL